MKLTYLGKTYDCVSAERKPNEIIIHTGKVVDGEEIVYHIYGDINFDDVVLEGGTWSGETDTATTDDILNALLGVTV